MSQRDLPRPRVFVAEDDRGVLELLRTRLSLAGYDVNYAYDGMEAVRSIPDCRPDAIILDVNMPRLDGFDVLRALKASQPLAAIPVMMLTARNAPGDVKTAIALGANDFLAKPFHDELLLMRVARLLRSRGILPKREADDAFMI